MDFYSLDISFWPIPMHDYDYVFRENCPNTPASPSHLIPFPGGTNVISGSLNPALRYPGGLFIALGLQGKLGGRWFWEEGVSSWSGVGVGVRSPSPELSGAIFPDTPPTPERRDFSSHRPVASLASSEGCSRGRGRGRGCSAVYYTSCYTFNLLSLIKSSFCPNPGLPAYQHLFK